MKTLITNKLIEEFDPCTSGYSKYLEHYPNWSGSILEFLKLENVPVEDKQWLILREDFLPEKELHLYACWCAEQTLPIFEAKYPDDKRPRLAIEAKRKFVNGEISKDELDEARAAADAAAYAAAYAAADAAARAAAAYAAHAAAYAAAHAAAYAAAYAAADAAADARESQLDELIRVVTILVG